MSKVKDESKDENEKFTVRTPDAGFRGERAGVTFFDGTASVEDVAKAIELHGLGYQVEPDPRKAKGTK
jgi:hypothetical protein